MNWVTSLNDKEFEHNRKWAFTTLVKRTHVHTFPPKSGKEQQVLVFRNPNKKLHRSKLSHYCICCISKAQTYKITFHFARRRRKRGSSKNRTDFTSLPAKKSQAKWISSLFYVLEPDASLTLACPFLCSLSVIHHEEGPLRSKAKCAFCFRSTELLH